MDLRTWPHGPENPKIFKRFYSERACEWHYGVNPVIRLKADPLVMSTEEAFWECQSQLLARKHIGKVARSANTPPCKFYIRHTQAI